MPSQDRTIGPARGADLFFADTNVYLVAAGDSAFRTRLEAFVLERGPLLVSAVVASEVLIGVADPAEHQTAVAALTAGAASLLAPTADDWLRAGAAVARLGGSTVTKSRSFWNDALLAAQCARIGATLVTQNTADFRRLGRHLGVRVSVPFP